MFLKERQSGKIKMRGRNSRRSKPQRSFSTMCKHSETTNNSTMTQSTSEIQQQISHKTISHFVNLGLSSSSWCLLDTITQKQLGFRQTYQRQIASLTKIMTTLISLQLMDRLNLQENLLVRVTKNASQQIGTTAFLRQNKWIQLKDLLYGAMLPSGNDAAYLLAEVIGYFLLASRKVQREDNYFSTVETIDLTNQFNTNLYYAEFLKTMNMYASKLKLKNTRFSNPHGLPNAMNFSSAQDIIKLSQHAIRNDRFIDIMNSQHHSYFDYQNEWREEKINKKWWNTNQLLKKGWSGVKTGHTNSAGNCLTSLRDGIYIVVLNCNSCQSRFSETEKLYNWYIQNYRPQLSTTDSEEL